MKKKVDSRVWAVEWSDGNCLVVRVYDTEDQARAAAGQLNDCDPEVKAQYWEL